MGEIQHFCGGQNFSGAGGRPVLGGIWILQVHTAFQIVTAKSMKEVLIKWEDFGKVGAVFRNGGVGRNSEQAGRFR